MLSKPLSLAQRVALWDGALSVIRAYLREEGLLEVSTRTRVEAPAIEPHIEPLTAAGRYLATSPEIEMKQLLAAGSGSIFQIAHVFRGGEVGPRHREEFHLVEWYRVGEGAFAAIEGDVEVIVERVRESVAHVGGESTGAPSAGEWARWDFADLWRETVGRELPTGMDAIERELVAVSGGEGRPLSWPDEGVDPALRELDAWTSLFSWWSDRHLDPWLAANPGGLHLHRFPAALAALAQVDGPHAHRFESYAGGVELANG